MKLIVTWLIGVPVAVVFFFAVFSVDASKIIPTVGSADKTQSLLITPSPNNRSSN